METLTTGFLSSVLFCKFIQNIPDNQLVRQKLNCMSKIVESNLFRQSGKSPPKPAACCDPALASVANTGPLLSATDVLASVCWHLRTSWETSFKEKVKSVQYLQ